MAIERVRQRCLQERIGVLITLAATGATAMSCPGVDSTLISEISRLGRALL